MIQYSVLFKTLLLLLLYCFWMNPIMANWIPSTVIRGPYLQSGTPISAILKWRTSNSTDSKVWYGTNLNSLSDSVTITSNRTDHEVMLNGLNPQTIYYYVIGSSEGKMEGGTSDFYIKTAPIAGEAEPTIAWILGDCGTKGSGQAAVRDAYYNYIGDKHTDMILLLGDNAYGAGWDSDYQKAIFEVYDEKLKNTMMWSCPGNHDYSGQSGLAADYYDIFTFPTRGEAGGLPSNTERYFSFDYANIHIISLDSHDEDRSIGSPMLTWLENDLAANLLPWTVVIFHHPPYTKGSHNSDSEGILVEMRENVIPICESYGVDLVLSGHSHSYERSHLIHGHYGKSNTYEETLHAIDLGDGRVDGDGAYEQNDSLEGTVYIVTGSAGKVSEMGYRHPIMYYSEEQLGSTILEVDHNQMDIKFLDDQGVIADYLSIFKDEIAPPGPSIRWAYPQDQQIFTDLTSINFKTNVFPDDSTLMGVVFLVDNTLIDTVFNTPNELSWTPPAYGVYQLKAVGMFGDSNIVSHEISISVQNGYVGTIEVQVNNDNDDAEERIENGYVNIGSADLEMVDDDGVMAQEVGIRFKNIDIPPGAVIEDASIQFTVEEPDIDSTHLLIWGQAHDNPPTFSNDKYDITSRAKTATSVPWQPAEWTVIGASTVKQQSPNISPVIQEIVDRPGWLANQSMAFIITGAGKRTAESYDGRASAAPKLSITFSVGRDTCEVDEDGDGYCLLEDCDDTDSTIYPLALCDDGDSTTVLDQYNDSCICLGIVPVPQDTIDVQDTVMVVITSGNDDVEEHPNGYMYRTSTDIELIEDGDKLQKVGLRFNNIPLPKNATVENAYIQFRADESDSDTTNLNIYGESSDNATSFSGEYFDLSSRPLTSATVNWIPQAWQADEVSIHQQTPDLSAVVYEIVNRDGWDSGNSMVFVIEGVGVRTAESYEGMPLGAAQLQIIYSYLETVDREEEVVRDSMVTENINTRMATPLSGSLRCYPNPTTGELIVAYEVLQVQNTKVELFNAIGSRVMSVPFEVYEGENSLKLNIAHLPEGIYWVKIQERNRKLVERIVLIKE